MSTASTTASTISCRWCRPGSTCASAADIPSPNHTESTNSSPEIMTMSTSIKAAQLVIARASALAAAIFVFVAITATPSHAQVENVKICTLYGAGFFYIPGTDTCTYAQQIVDNQF